MDFTKNVVLKENYTFLVADAAGMVPGGERGLYNRDTRFLSRYAWSFDRDTQVLLAHSARPDRFEVHHGVIEGPSQVVGVRRQVTVAAAEAHDELEVTNTDLQPQSLTLTLAFGADFADLFEARGWYEGGHPTATQVGEDGVRVTYQADDGMRQGVELAFSPAPTCLSESEATFAFELQPHERRSLTVRVRLDNPLETARPAVAYEAWRAAFAPDALGSALDPFQRRVLDRAVEDLRALLLFTEEGPVPAAGIPWFVTAFGRDSLLTASMLLPHAPEVARGTLRYLAARQGRERNAVRAEAPGKILHEVRSGALARTGRVPFGRYFGTIDATPLFLVLLYQTWRATGDDALVRELRPNWEAALGWMQTDGDPDEDGFLEFAGAAPGEGLTVQSWKDSHDALSHADGTLATGAIAVSEVQGYAFAAYRAAAEFYRALGEHAPAARWRDTAASLQRRFHEAFWQDGLGSYALALDGDKRPLAVLASDAGQLLWTGIVPEDVAPTLVGTLFSEALFSGWGIRTLGTGEVRYNPVSYHNGSVWPHDTALIAGGLARYGFPAEAARLRGALFDLAAGQADLRPPELVAGYVRGGAPPVTYPVACRPQAWSAAALVYVAGIATPR
ncbi:MAG TPA: glycogen debranching N-terminal domain-containing protein [Trueperaceae bacterium]|nr:glycogen debranching N-terminal domain-containing protein [Trueperaceae bacterium]